MKRIILCSVFILILIGMTTQGMGQGFKITQPNAVGGSFVGTHPDGSDGMGPGLEMFLKYNVSPRFFLSAGTGVYTITDGTFKTDNFRTTLLPTLEIRAGYGLTEGSQFLPFIYGGLHAYGFKSTMKVPSYTSDTYYDAGALIGGGFRYAFNELWSFHAMGDYRYIFTATTPEGVSKPQYWMAKAGLTYALQPSGQPRREEIEYPLGEGEISLDDLFNQEVVSETNDLTEEDALALLFQPEEQDPGDMDVFESLGAAEEAAPDLDISSIPDSELDLRIQEMRTEMDRRSSQISALQDQVDANERAIAQFSQGRVAGTSTAFTSDDFKTNYQQALQTFHNKQFQEAIQMFRSLMNSNPNHRLASNCQYWIGESYNAMKQYREALSAFTSVMNYRTSYKFDDALIMSGLCNMRLGDSATARENFEQLVSRYPNSEYAPKAMRYLGRL